MSQNALIVWGGWNGHEPQKCAELWGGILSREGFAVRLSDTLDVFKEKDYLQSLSLITPIWSMGTIESDQLSGLLETVKRGVGIAGFHGGMCDSFRVSTSYQFMTGGQWVAHPDGIIDYTVNVTNQTDPITRGIADFKVHSEQYYMHTDPSNEVLATTTIGDNQEAPWVKGAVMPVVWKRRWGRGRVFFSSLGHVASEFDVPEVKEIQRRGMLWAASAA